MDEALRRTGVPRDVPEEIEELEAKQGEATKDKKKEADDVSLAELSTPLTPDEMKAATGEADETSDAESADPSAPRVPDFVGKTVKDVMVEAAANNLELQMLGDGVARSQDPAAGTVLIPGEHIRVRFAR
jgi:hypothetical protein